MSAKATLVDAVARRRIAEDLDATFVVEAAAGTGKTTALVSRIVTLLASGRASAQTLIATTFTEKAAGELVVRTREALEAALREPTRPEAERERLARAVAELEVARIGTIHGLATDLLRERPIAAGLDPAFRVHGEEETAELLEAVVSRWLEDRLAAPPPAIRRLLRRTVPHGETLRGALVKICAKLADRRELTAPWRGPALDRAARITEVLGRLEALAPLVAEARAGGAREDDELVASLEALSGAPAQARLAEALAGRRDDDALEELLVGLLSLKHQKGRGKLGKLAREPVLAERDRAIAALEGFKRDADGELAAALHPELLAAVAAYEAEKRRLGVVDYADLLLTIRRVLVEDATVRAELQARFTHVLVDEVQDTDPVQLEIVRLLVSDDPTVADPHRARPRPGKLFVVGDPKQAIYRFRRADLETYFESRAALVAAGAEVLHLTTSFRAEPSIQAAVNRALGEGDHALPEYVPLSPYRAERTDRPSVVVLPVPAPYGGKWDHYFSDQIRSSYAEAVGAYVHWLISESGWTVDEEGREVPLEARHVAILFKQTTGSGKDLVHPYARALERRGVAIRSGERRAFFEREEIHALRTVLAAIEWVDDEIAVYGALAGPYLALSDAELLQYQREHGSLHPLRAPKKEEPSADARTPAKPAPGEDVADALRLLRSLHVTRNHLPFAETLQRFLDATRAHALLALQAQGERAVANVQHLVGMARRAEARGVLSFRRFVEELEARAEDGKHGEVTTEDDTTRGVQLSTVHGAKGLEFPVVVLADPAAQAYFDRPTSFTDRRRGVFVERVAGITPLELGENEARARDADAGEARRLLYVAATRARDLLVVPGAGDDALDGWCSPLELALRPGRGGVSRAPAPAPGCPHERFGRDTIQARPARYAERALDTIEPGLYRFGRASEGEGAAHTSGAVVWWGPAALALETASEPGVRAEELLIVPKDAPAPDDGSARSKALALARTRRLDRVRAGGEGEREPLAVLAQKPLSVASVEVDVEDAPLELGIAPELLGRKTEALLRGALAVALSLGHEPEAARDAVEDAVRYVGRSLAAEPREVEAAISMLTHVLAEARLASVLDGARAVRTDVWVALTTPTGSLGEGRLAAVVEREGERWALGITLAGELLEVRRTELGLAATALAREPGSPVRARLWVVG
jgi:ATP-dependent exoDNAse (exonuclease V) beta subunit